MKLFFFLLWKQFTEYEFLKVVKANTYMCTGPGRMYFITFEVRDPYDNLLKLFQTRVRHDYDVTDDYILCRPKPYQKGIIVVLFFLHDECNPSIRPHFCLWISNYGVHLYNSFSFGSSSAYMTLFCNGKIWLFCQSNALDLPRHIKGKPVVYFWFISSFMLIYSRISFNLFSYVHDFCSLA